MNPFPYAEDKNKRYHSWNFALRQEFGEKSLKSPSMRASTAPIVTAPLPKAAVHFAVCPVLAI